MSISDTQSDVRDVRLTLRERAALAAAPRRRPEQQPWNLVAKYRRAEQIGREEELISRLAAFAQGIPGAHNNELDAPRHARWSERMSTEIDPVTSLLVGVGREIEGSVRRAQPRAEALRDGRNNAEGRRAARDGHPIDPGRLQMGVAPYRPAMGHGF